MNEQYTGGCLCGGVRYRLASEPFDAGWCHCRICQLTSGSPAMAFATVPTGDWSIDRGEDKIRKVQSSSFGHRLFCAECGTSLGVRVDFQPETVDFPIATLDRPDAVAPGFHIFTSSQVTWFDPDDDLPRYERFRPGTRGLDGIEPPDES